MAERSTGDSTALEAPCRAPVWRVWIQNFTWTEEATLRFRSDTEVPLARAFVNSPFDLDARLGRKRATYWVGYKAHLTETCDEDPCWDGLNPLPQGIYRC